MIKASDSGARPLAPDVGVIAMVPDHWNGWWQLRHQVLSRLAHYFHVAWVDPAPEWREMLKERRKPNARDGAAAQRPGFLVYKPEFWLPKLHRPEWLARLTFDARLTRARRLLLGRGCRKIILYLWRPEFASALASVPFDLSCYHIDDDYSFSDTEAPPDQTELGLIAKVDQVFIHSRGLLEKKGAINPNTVLIPNGVDFRAYAEPAEEPRDLADIPHPRIGYTGLLKKQLDWPLMLQLTGRHPDWSFVLVGPLSRHPEIMPAVEELSRRGNVYFLGGKSIRELPAYPQHFDVCIMPYRKTEYTKYIYPLKIHEYLAGGRPTVGTRIRSLEEFADVVGLAAGSEEWSAEIAKALAAESTTAERRAARQAVARRYDWPLLVAQIARTMAQKLSDEFARRFLDASALEARDINIVS